MVAPPSRKILISFPGTERDQSGGIPLGEACAAGLREMGFTTLVFNPIVGSQTNALAKIAERLCILLGKLAHLSKAEVQNRLPWLEEVRRQNAFLAAAQDFQPDILLVISTFTYPKSTLTNIKQTCANLQKTIGWCVEGPTWRVSPNQEAELYDEYFCIHTIGTEHSKIKPLSAIAWDAKSYQKIEGQTKRSDLVFVGRQKQRRIEWLSPLAKLGLNIHGPGWKNTDLSQCLVSQGVWGDHLNQIYNEAKIALNVSAWPNDQFGCLNLRILDIPATGTLLITDYASNIEEYLTPDKEVVVASSPEEMADKVAYYLAHDSAREKIALAGWEKVQKFETYTEKMKRMLAMANVSI